MRVFVKMPSVCADIDECKNPENVCLGHGCINLLGSYRCECQAGYIFNSISRLCEGKQSFPSLHRNKPHWIPLHVPKSRDMQSTCLCKWMELCSKPGSLGVLDINECRHYPGRLCAHKCENTPGSYKCSCTTGFKLASDGRNCDGNVMLNIPSGFYLSKLATHVV